MHHNVVVLFFVLAHLAGSVFVLYYFKKHGLRLEKFMLFFLFLLPFIGSICIFAYLSMVKEGRYISDFRADEGEEHIVMEEKIQDEIKEVNRLVPLADALVMNDTGVRRRMILDIINDNPEANLDLIQEASLNDDTEVVHYATTIISEISAKFEKEMKIAKEQYLADPESKERLGNYLSLLDRYLKKNLVFGELEKLKREEYVEVLKDYLRFSSDLRTVSQIVENALILCRFDEANRYLEMMRGNWPMEEETWILGFKSLCKQNKISQARELASEAWKNNIYISTKNKAFMRFFLPNEEVA